MRPSMLKLVLLWLVVSLPLAWGIYKAIEEIHISSLFKGQ